MLMLWMVWAVPNAAAAGSVDDLSYSSYLSGYSATWLDWEQTEYYCHGDLYQDESGNYYCYGVAEAIVPWVQVNGILYTPSYYVADGGVSSDSYYASIGYYASPSEGGTWTVFGDHYLAYDHYYTYCYIWECNEWGYEYTDYYEWYGYAYAYVPNITLTWMAWNPDLVIAPGCWSLNWDSEFPTIDLVYHRLEDDLWDTAYDYPNGLQSCVTEEETYYFGHYEITEVRVPGGVWAPPPGPVAIFIQAPPVTVNFTCSKLNLAIGGTPVTGTNTGTCTATGTPANGTFSWSVNTDRVNLSATTGATITYTSANPSAMGQPTVITVTYTFNNTPVSATIGNIWVRQPTSLAVRSDTSTTITCMEGGFTFPGPQRQRGYDALDQLGESIFDVGIATNTVESFPYTHTCSGTYTLSTGNPGGSKFTDTYRFCHTDNRPGGPTCTMSSDPSQVWSVNGIAVGTFTVRYTQTSITITP
jgi:hypothetical protein